MLSRVLSKKGLPFQDLSKYDYALNSNMEKYAEGRHPNIQSFTQDETYGKTLEYQLAFENPKCRLLLTPSLQNKDELNDLITMLEDNKPLDEMLDKLRGSVENNRIAESITKLDGDSWSDEAKKKSIIASRYLNSVGKGENALELSSILRENLSNKDMDGFKEFNVPAYIKDAIEWMCEDR